MGGGGELLGQKWVITKSFFLLLITGKDRKSTELLKKKNQKNRKKFKWEEE